jgi:hypothetical protein
MDQVMKDDRLRIYVNDHLALLVGEIQLANRSWASNRETPLGDFLEQLEADLKQQRRTTSDVQKKIGGTENVIKQGAAWFAEKLGRFKLNDSLLTYSSLSRVIELETLAAAAQERAALWDNLAAITNADRRLKRFDFIGLRDQSKKHLSSLNTRRRRAAREAFLQE